MTSQTPNYKMRKYETTKQKKLLFIIIYFFVLDFLLFPKRFFRSYFVHFCLFVIRTWATHQNLIQIFSDICHHILFIKYFTLNRIKTNFFLFVLLLFSFSLSHLYHIKLIVPDHVRPRVCSLPERPYNPRQSDDLYRLRTFSISKGIVVNCGDSIISRRSRSNTSVNSTTSR